MISTVSDPEIFLQHRWVLRPVHPTVVLKVLLAAPQPSPSATHGVSTYRPFRTSAEVLLQPETPRFSSCGLSAYLTFGAARTRLHFHSSLLGARKEKSISSATTALKGCSAGFEPRAYGGVG